MLYKTVRKIILGPRKHIVIIGANFAGLKTAMGLSSKYKVTVIDRTPFFEYLPNIHELVSGVKMPSNLQIPRERIVRWAGHRFLLDTVLEVDSTENRIVTADGKQLRFDILVVSVGGENNTFGVKGAETHALPFKSVSDCYEIGKRLTTLFKDKTDLSVVIVGGGLEGIEALGEILRKYRDRPGLKIHVVERNKNLVPEAPSVLGKEILTLCKPYPVTFHHETAVTEVTSQKVMLSNGLILNTDITIWTGGAKAPDILYQSSLSPKAEQWAPVTDTLQSCFFENIFVIGDAAKFKPPIGKQAYHAMDMGTWAAENITRKLSGRPLKPFSTAEKPMLLSFGDLTTFLASGSSVLTGAALAGIKEAVYQYTMVQMDSPLGLLPMWDFYQRAKTGAFKLFFPSMTSLSALKRLSDIRMLE